MTIQQSLLRILLLTASILLLPLLAMRFSAEVDWNLTDFFVAAALLAGTGLSYELVVRKAVNTTYRAAVGLALATALLLVWVNLAVGLIGFEDNPANLMYLGVLAVGVIAAIGMQFQPHGMSRALLATAIAQVLVAIVALLASWEEAGSLWPLDVIGATGFFTALWLTSAWLFRKAAQAALSE